jgi:hypothetical protein
MINEYFEMTGELISSYSSIIKSYSKTEKAYSHQKGVVHGKIIFINDYSLTFMELVDVVKETKNKYSYHFMDNRNCLIFRYDNSEHHPEIETFPHHRHNPNTIENSTEPNLENVLNEIFRMFYIS